MSFYMNVRAYFAIGLATLAIFSCSKEPVSTTDPLPLPPGMEESKDLSVKPGDSFYDYCNGTWIKNTPIPAMGTVGPLYDQERYIDELLEQLKKNVPDVGRFFELLDAPGGNMDATQAFVNTLKTQYAQPKTKEEAFLLMGKMLADGFPLWGNPIMPAWTTLWKEGKLVGILTPPFDTLPITPPTHSDLDPAQYVPLTATKAGAENSAPSLIIKGMGQDPSQFMIDSDNSLWAPLEAMSLEQLCKYIDDAWKEFEQFGEEAFSEDATAIARLSMNYTLSYHFAQAYLSPEFKEKYTRITREIQAALRKRIQQVEWMSETTKNNALEKLDQCGVNVAYPDQWYTDAVAKLSDCATLAEAVYRNRKGLAKLRGHLMGTTDTFSQEITMPILSGTQLIPADLLLVNAMYHPGNNAVYIFPAMMLPPLLPEKVSIAFEYASFTMIGHEFTHGFDSEGSKRDKWGNMRNWWTVADKMAFEERRDLLVDSHNHLEIDPVRRPGTYSDGENTQTEDIADLGGFLAVLDAYKARLEADGYTGETYKEQLRKFYESYAEFWKVQYGEQKLSTFPKNDVHSHARIRVNGTVMNTDLWYQLYGIDRNSVLYLPKERRTYIW